MELIKAPPLAEQLCFDLYAASRAVTAAYRPVLTELGLTYPQYLVLIVLWEHQSRTVRELEDLGLITRTPDPEDGRSSLLSPTPEGLERLAAARAPQESLLLDTLDATLLHGRFLDSALVRYPAVVLGHYAAGVLGIRDVTGQPRVWLHDRWFTVVGVLAPVELAPELDAAALIGAEVAAADFGFQGHPTRIFVRAETSRTEQVAGLLGRAADPGRPEEVAVSRGAKKLAQICADDSADLARLSVALRVVRGLVAS